jgi:hypothetical protein
MWKADGKVAKIMVVIRDENFRLLSLEAASRGISIQELIRAVVVPEWFRNGGIPTTRPEGSSLQVPQLGQRPEIPMLSRSRP